jgi:uncharacterized protein with FMN-binding domain
MKRISIWALSTLSAVVLLFSYSTSTSGSTGATSALHSQPAISSSGTGSTSTPSTSSDSGSTPSDPASGSSSSAERTVTGSVASTRWGPVQVQLTVADGTITQVSVLQYPNGNGKDAEINNYALPILTQETVDAQSANIDMVSGATVTSDGYVRSLQSALDEANL